MNWLECNLTYRRFSAILMYAVQDQEGPNVPALYILLTMPFVPMRLTRGTYTCLVSSLHVHRAYTCLDSSLAMPLSLLSCIWFCLLYNFRSQRYMTSTGCFTIIEFRDISHLLISTTLHYISQLFCWCCATIVINERSQITMNWFRNITRDQIIFSITCDLQK